MRNIKMMIKYEGSKYRGWQRLGDTDLTIQGKIENVLSKMTEEKIEIIGSGRTDAGVHALGQIANFKTNSQMPIDRIREYLYKYLPEDIVIESLEEVDERFHARYNAVSKTYIYKIWNYKYHDPFLRKQFMHIPGKLNIAAMQEAANYLIGEHDFSSFTTLKSKKKSKVREIHSIEIIKKDKNVYIIVNGNGFMHNMVRIIVGTLLEVGQNKMKANDVKYILTKKDRQLAGPTVTAQGLYLSEVKY